MNTMDDILKKKAHKPALGPLEVVYERELRDEINRLGVLESVTLTRLLAWWAQKYSNPSHEMVDVLRFVAMARFTSPGSKPQDMHVFARLRKSPIGGSVEEPGWLAEAFAAHDTLAGLAPYITPEEKHLLDFRKLCPPGCAWCGRQVPCLPVRVQVADLEPCLNEKICSDCGMMVADAVGEVKERRSKKEDRELGGRRILM